MRFPARIMLLLILCAWLPNCAEEGGAPRTTVAAATTAGPIDAEAGPWRQQNHWVAVHGTHDLILTRLCRPQNPEPARLVVINHGSPPNAAQRPAFTPWSCDRPAVQWFLQRGYAVALPLRRGYGASKGPWAEAYGRCDFPDFTQASQETARDIVSAVDYVSALPGIRAGGVIIVGQSAGGWGALGLAAQNPQKVAAIVNMAGGRGGRLNNAANTNCRADLLVESAGRLGQTARIPSIWIYTENDSFFAPAIAAAMHRNYTAAGGVAEFHALPAFGQDGHGLFSAANGTQIWGPLVEAFLSVAVR